MPSDEANPSSTRTRSTRCTVPDNALEPESGQSLSWLSTVVPDPRIVRFVPVSRERIVADTPTSSLISGVPTSATSLTARAVPS